LIYFEAIVNGIVQSVTSYRIHFWGLRLSLQMSSQDSQRLNALLAGGQLQPQTGALLAPEPPSFLPQWSLHPPRAHMPSGTTLVSCFLCDSVFSNEFLISSDSAGSLYVVESLIGGSPMSWGQRPVGEHLRIVQ
jgi:hypothetical protein